MLYFYPVKLCISVDYLILILPWHYHDFQCICICNLHIQTLKGCQKPDKKVVCRSTHGTYFLHLFLSHFYEHSVKKKSQSPFDFFRLHRKCSVTLQIIMEGADLKKYALDFLRYYLFIMKKKKKIFCGKHISINHHQ